jgi:hypothetical protein
MNDEARSVPGALEISRFFRVCWGQNNRSYL